MGTKGEIENIEAITIEGEIMLQLDIKVCINDVETIVRCFTNYEQFVSDMLWLKDEPYY